MSVVSNDANYSHQHFFSTMKSTSNAMISGAVRFIDSMFDISEENTATEGMNDMVNMVEEIDKCSIINNEPKSMKGFNSLPDEAVRYIFSYLDAISLWRAACVSRSWQIHADDPLLWKQKLKVDCKKWEMISHSSDPELYNQRSELTSKEIYARCCPECRRRQRYQFLVHMPRITFYLGLSVPRIVMFGPGLESSTSGLLTKLLWDKMSPFTVKKMFPGEFEGVGSGVCLQYSGGQVNLITLYGSTRSERERQGNEGGQRLNRLFIPDAAEQSQRDVEMGWQPVMLTQPVRELCSTIDGFIYVVDASCEKSTVQYAWNEFEAMIIKNKWLQPKAPLLIVSCTPHSSPSKVPVIDVVELLELRQLERKWQVRECHVDTMYGFLPGISWLCKEVTNS